MGWTYAHSPAAAFVVAAAGALALRAAALALDAGSKRLQIGLHGDTQDNYVIYVMDSDEFPFYRGEEKFKGQIVRGVAYEADVLERSCRQSLERLGCEYIDLYQLHWPSRDTPVFGCAMFYPEPKGEGGNVKEYTNVQKKRRYRTRFMAANQR